MRPCFSLTPPLIRKAAGTVESGAGEAPALVDEAKPTVELKWDALCADNANGEVTYRRVDKSEVSNFKLQTSKLDPQRGHVKQRGGNKR